MKDRSLFAQILLLVILTFVCIGVTIFLALLAGSVDVSIFDFKNLNIANMIPVLIFGGLISGLTVIITLLFTSRTLFHKIKGYIENGTKNNDK